MKEQNKQIEVIEQRPFKDLIKDVRTKERFEENNLDGFKTYLKDLSKILNAREESSIG